MEVLSLRAINRATLARQLLVERETRPAESAIEHLVGLQAQAPFPPYTGLWTRLVDFRPAELADALVERRVVRVVLMRGTVHLVTAADACFLRPLVQVIMDRDLRTNVQHARNLTDVDIGKVADAARSALEDEALTAKELGVELATRWPSVPPGSLAHVARGQLTLVQVPPRAVWGRSGQTRYRTVEHWLGRSVDAAPDPARLVLRYLGAFGPATVADIQTWSGLTRLREVVDPLRSRLRVFADESGRELIDLPDAPRPPADLPVPVRFLPEFDNLLLSHADRSRVMSEEFRKRLFGVKNGVFPGTFLVDGFLRGEWRVSKARKAATLTITPWGKVSKKDTAALVREGRRMLEFAAPDAESRDVLVA
ncbi:MAG: winged helix DNA-binding domain-containing protein [Actinophytocola sp.]|uniref:winged helix DNA-binding domain-containing protein n=1 Tax=Actinophytocola sp. TaxID=1872138 RepID=UPI003D6BC890